MNEYDEYFKALRKHLVKTFFFVFLPLSAVLGMLVYIVVNFIAPNL